MPLVTNPTAGDVHVNTPLTNFSQKFLQDAGMFVGTRAFTPAPVSNQSDLYYTFSRADFFRDEAKERADGAETAGGSFNLSTDPYYAHVYGFHKDVTDRQRANQDSPVRLDQSATQYVTQKLMILRERLFAARFFVGNIWFNGGTAASAGQNVNWLPAGSDPILDVKTAIRGVHAITGFRPNRMLIGRTGWDTLTENDEIIARISGGSTTAMPAKVQMQLIAELFEIDEIFVMDSVFNSAAEGATESTGFIAADNCLLYYAEPGTSLDAPTAGVNFSWTGLFGATNDGIRIKRFRHEPTASDRIEGEMSFDYRVTSPELGHLFTTVSAA